MIGFNFLHLDLSAFRLIERIHILMTHKLDQHTLIDALPLCSAVLNTRTKKKEAVGKHWHLNHKFTQVTLLWWADRQFQQFSDSLAQDISVGKGRTSQSTRSVDLPSIEEEFPLYPRLGEIREDTKCALHEPGIV